MKVSLILLFLINVSLVSAQSHERINLEYRQVFYDVGILKLDSLVLSRSLVLENNTLDTEQLSDSLGKIGVTYFACNAAPYDEDGKFLGLFIRSRRVVQNLNTGSGAGNFYIKPNGVWAIENNNFNIVSSDKFISSPSLIYAVQSGPMLVIDGVLNPSLDPNSVNRNIRLGIGLYKKDSSSYLVLIRSQRPVTFYDFALLFKEKFMCNNALYLDGGECAMLLMPSVSRIGCKGHIQPNVLLFQVN